MESIERNDLSIVRIVGKHEDRFSSFTSSESNASRRLSCRRSRAWIERQDCGSIASGSSLINRKKNEKKKKKKK